MESFTGRQVETIAKTLLGEPNRSLSNLTSLRFGTRGSLAVDLAKGTWFDHEASTGGGLIDLVLRERGGSRTEALSFLANHGVELRSGRQERSRVVATYNYRDEGGALLYQVERLEPKRFRQRRPAQDGKWVYKLNGVRRVLYRLPEILSSSPDAIVFLVEGEKDADVLCDLGLCATTNAGGANKWREDYSRQLAGRRVVVLPDNDDVGHQHANSIHASLAKHCSDVRILALPNLPPKGDVSDWIAAGGTVEQLLKLAEDCERTQPTEVAGKLEPPQTLPERPGRPLPVPLFREAERPLPYPLECLGPLREPVEAIQVLAEAPDAICAHSVLGAVSLLAQGLVDVETLGGTAPTSLALLSIATSGERKSACDRHALNGIRRWERSNLKRYESQFAIFENEIEIYEDKKREILKGADCIARDVDLDALKPPQAPLRPKMLVADATVEGIARHFDEGIPSMGLFTDEGGVFLGGHAMKSENKVKTSSILSKLWDGAEFDRVRASGPPKTYSGRRVTTHFMIQPQQAQAFLEDDQVRDQGLINRFLIAEPESRIGDRLGNPEQVISDALARLDAFHTRLDELAQLPLATTEDNGKELEPRVLRLDDNARELVMQFYRKVEIAQKVDGECENIRGFASKSTEHAIRLAGVLQIYADPRAHLICADIMANALGLVDWYLQETRRLLTSSPIREQLSQAQLLLDWIKKKRSCEEFCQRDLTRNGPNRLREGPLIKQLLTLLEQHHWIERAPTNEVNVPRYRLVE